jgi:hypothetical protein
VCIQKSHSESESSKEEKEEHYFDAPGLSFNAPHAGFMPRVVHCICNKEA